MEGFDERGLALSLVPWLILPLSSFDEVDNYFIYSLIKSKMLIMFDPPLLSFNIVNDDFEYSLIKSHYVDRD